jgi:hypothetical protein
LSETFFILRRTERGITKNIYWSSCKVSFILFPVLMKLEFPDRFLTNTQIYNFMKIHPVGTELLRAEGWTGMTKLILAFVILQMRLIICKMKHHMCRQWQCQCPRFFNKTLWFWIFCRDRTVNKQARAPVEYRKHLEFKCSGRKMGWYQQEKV